MFKKFFNSMLFLSMIFMIGIFNCNCKAAERDVCKITISDPIMETFSFADSVKMQMLPGIVICDPEEYYKITLHIPGESEDFSFNLGCFCINEHKANKGKTIVGTHNLLPEISRTKLRKAYEKVREISTTEPLCINIMDIISSKVPHVNREKIYHDFLSLFGISVLY